MSNTATTALKENDWKTLRFGHFLKSTRKSKNDKKKITVNNYSHRVLKGLNPLPLDWEVNAITLRHINSYVITS